MATTSASGLSYCDQVQLGLLSRLSCWHGNFSVGNAHIRNHLVPRYNMFTFDPDCCTQLLLPTPTLCLGSTQIIVTFEGSFGGLRRVPASFVLSCNIWLKIKTMLHNSHPHPDVRDQAYEVTSEWWELGIDRTKHSFQMSGSYLTGS
jgi:hypothetical protein